VRFESPVADAAKRGDRAAVKTLLQQGADANAAHGDGMTALHWAATHGDAEMARMLVVAGARLEAVTRNGNYTPLHLAARVGSAPVLTTLLDAGANVKAATSSGGATALHLAAAQGSAAAVTTLLDRGAEVDAKETAFGQTALMWAAAFDRVSAIEALIARKADLTLTSAVENVTDKERADRAAATAKRRTAVPQQYPDRAGGANAAGRGATAAGAPAQGQRGAGGGRGTAGDSANAGPQQLSYGQLVGNKGGLTPLLFAAREGNLAAVNALLKAGADINQVSKGDQTSPMLMATLNGHFDIAKLLLDKGADPKLASDANATPLYATINVQWSAKSLYPQPTAYKQQKITYLELMEALLKAGADPNVRLSKHLWYMSYNFDLLGVNTTGATPFWRAAYGTDVTAMRLLKQYGADHTIPTTKLGGRARGDDAPAEDDASGQRDPSGLPPVPNGGPGVFAIHAASGVGYGAGYAANAHRHAPDGWLPSLKYLIEELGVDVNQRDHDGFNAIHHAAARGDNEAILYLVSKGGDVKAVSRRGQTTADMANGPVQRVPPFLETVALLEKLGSVNNHKCRSC
jgi:ankyrin repeat protein